MYRVWGDGKQMVKDDKFDFFNTFRYTDFDLTLFVSGSVGNKVMNYLNISMSRMNNAWVNQSASVKGARC